MKTIGYVLADFPVFSETFVGNEMRAVMDHGHRVVPIILRPGNGPAHPQDQVLADGSPKFADVAASDALAIAGSPGRSAARALAFARRQTRLPRRSLLWNAAKVAAIARRHGCGHLHAHFSGGAAAHAIVAARWLGISVSFVCHGHDVYAEPEDLPLKLRSADAVVAVCADMQADLRGLYAKAKVENIACGTDPGAFRPMKDGGRLSRFLFIGRLVGQKGIDDLLDAMALCAAAEIDIVGSGPLLEDCERRVRELGLGDRVRFLGNRSREWIVQEGPRYIGLVAPFKPASDGSRDSGPLVVKEAMAMGLPVIGTRFMGNKEMIAEDSGFLTPIGDPRALAEAIRSLLALSDNERRRMGLRGRARVIERFSLAAQARALSALFEAA